MKNQELVSDYLFRAQGRLKALDTLYQEKLYADTVRESQEVVELSLKALLINIRVEVPWVHDVSEILEQNKERFSKIVLENLEFLKSASHDLRRDRELAFYGTEDITPHTFYKEKHAKEAIKTAIEVVRLCKLGVQ